MNEFIPVSRRTESTEYLPDNTDFRLQILQLEESMKQVDGALIGRDTEQMCPLTHTFAEQVYAREIFLPKNSVVVGKIHKHSHLNFLMTGRVKVATEEGVKEITAPAMFVSAPGTKRVVFAVEDSVWITVHVTEHQDLEKIEEEIIAKSYEDINRISHTKSEVLGE
jgi:quercetin dioxygenase-like cupin family protein